MALDYAQRELGDWLPQVIGLVDKVEALDNPGVEEEAGDGEEAVIRRLERHYDSNLLMRRINAEFDFATAAASEARYEDASTLLAQQYEKLEGEYDPSLSESLLLAEPTDALTREFSEGCVAVFFPAFDRVLSTHWSVRANHTLERIALALAAHRADRGEYPASLVGLLPRYIGTIPVDCFNGEPVRYERTETGGARIWSVGCNLNDDGGEKGKDVVMQLISPQAD